VAGNRTVQRTLTVQRAPARPEPFWEIVTSGPFQEGLAAGFVAGLGENAAAGLLTLGLGAAAMRLGLKTDAGKLVAAYVVASAGVNIWSRVRDFKAAHGVDPTPGQGAWLVICGIADVVGAASAIEGARGRVIDGIDDVTLDPRERGYRIGRAAADIITALAANRVSKWLVKTMTHLAWDKIKGPFVESAKVVGAGTAPGAATAPAPGSLTSLFRPRPPGKELATFDGIVKLFVSRGELVVVRPQEFEVFRVSAPTVQHLVDTGVLVGHGGFHGKFFLRSQLDAVTGLLRTLPPRSTHTVGGLTTLLRDKGILPGLTPREFERCLSMLQTNHVLDISTHGYRRLEDMELVVNP